MSKREWIVLSVVTAVLLVGCWSWAAFGAEPVTRPGFQYHRVVNHDSCKVYIHPIAPWRPRRELHVSCTLKSGSEGPGARLYYRYPGKGMPSDFDVTYEDETHGGVGDGEYLRTWLIPGTKVGVLEVPGPHKDSPRGTYVHILKQVWSR